MMMEYDRYEEDLTLTNNDFDRSRDLLLRAPRAIAIRRREQSNYQKRSNRPGGIRQRRNKRVNW